MEKAGIKPKVAPIVRGPPFPERLDYLWRWFVEISGGLTINGMASPRIAWIDIEAWASVMRVELAPWEASVLVTLGNVRLSAEAAPETA